MKKKFLASFLVLCMMLTLVPITSFAANGDSAEAPIEITEDTSALENGKYYQLNEDVTLKKQIVVNQGIEAYINLGNGTLTAPEKNYAIQVNGGGKLHITGTEGTVKGSDYGALRNSGGEVNIEGGNFTSEWRITVKNEEGTDNEKKQLDGKMTISGGTFKCAKEPMDQAVQNFCNLTITGGEFKGKVVTWQEVGSGYADYGSTAITGGTFCEDVLIAQSKGKGGSDTSKAPKLEISGGDTIFEKNVGFFEGNDEADAPGLVSGSLTIEEATVNGDVYNGSKGTVVIDGAIVKGKITNKAKGDKSEGTGSVFVTNSKVDAVNLDDTIIATDNTTVSGEAIADKVPADVVALVDGQPYKDLSSALAAGSSKTIKLMANIKDVNETVNSGSCIFDLNGHTITAADGKVAIIVSHGAALEITDSSAEKKGTIIREDDKNVYVVLNHGTMTFSGGTIKSVAKGATALANRSTTGGKAAMTIGGGKVEADYIAIKNDCESGSSLPELTINSGIIAAGKDQVVQNWGNATINGGTFSGCVGTWTDGKVEIGQTSITGGKFDLKDSEIKPSGVLALFLFGDNATGTQERPAKVDISGDIEVNGKFILAGEEQNIPVVVVAKFDMVKKKSEPVEEIPENVSATVSGGNFSDSVDEKYLSETFTAELKKPSGDTPYSYYTSVDDAIKAAADIPGAEIKMLNQAEDADLVTVALNNDGKETKIQAIAGTEITLPTPVKSGYTFKGWSGNQGKYTVPGADITLTAQWTKNSTGSSTGGGKGGSKGSASSGSTVTVPSNIKGGKVSVSPSNAGKGTTVTITATPDKGYVIGKVTAADKDGKEITVTKKEDGKYTFTMPEGKVSVQAEFAPEKPETPDKQPESGFVDVPQNAYYHDAVMWAVEKGITAGTSATTFSPDAACSRGQIVTFLWRAAGKPAAAGSNPFSDIAPDAYYYDAVLWAVEQGITAGTSATTFSPDETCTRGQIVTLLWRSHGMPAASGSGAFADVAADSYYADAVTWAVEQGITAGTSATTFSPEDDCTRGQIVTFLYRDMTK